MDIHNAKNKLKNSLVKIKNLDDPNRQYLIDFYNECMSRGLSPARTYLYIFKILRFMKAMKPKDLKKLDKKDIMIMSNFQ
jgi:hypothetical protein